MVRTDTVTAQGAAVVDPERGVRTSTWPPAGTSPGHHRGLQLATSGDFATATDSLDLVELRAFVSWAAANPNSYPPYNATAITDQKRAACDTKYFSSP